MKILERKPASYDAGIQKYAGGDFSRVRQEIVSMVSPGDRVLDVGCGPGTLAIECAKRGAAIEAVDSNPQMLYVADLAAKKEGVDDRIYFQHASAAEIDAELESFDVVVFSLSMSEMREVEQWIAFNSAFDFLKPGGRLVVVDEVLPETRGARIRYYLRRIPLLAITYVLTRATTKPVRALDEKFSACGFEIAYSKTYEHGSLKLVAGTRLKHRPEPLVLSPDRLSRWLELVGSVLSYLSLPFKAVPIRVGLYRFGNPSPDSPLLVTANYLLTFVSIKRHLRNLDCYLLVIDTRGINVWCAAGKGNFSSTEIGNSLRATRAGEIVQSRKLILPKLSANGVRYRDVKRTTGWQAVFGPVYAADIPIYLQNGLTKNEEMKRARFDLFERLWVGPPFALFVAFWFALPLLFIPNLYSWMVPAIALLAGIVFPLAFYMLPTPQFFKKGLVLGLVFAAAACLILLGNGASAREIVQWVLIVIGITVFVAMDFSGMSSVSNYSRIKQEYYVVGPLLVLIVLSYAAISLFWR